MKYLGYLLDIDGIAFIITSGKVWNWKNDGMPIWKHILYELIGFLLIGLGVYLINK